jgi:hypothetical protein
MQNAITNHTGQTMQIRELYPHFKGCNIVHGVSGEFNRYALNVKAFEYFENKSTTI